MTEFAVARCAGYASKQRLCHRANLREPPSICHIPLFTNAVIVIYVIIADNLVIKRAALRRLLLIDN